MTTGTDERPAGITALSFFFLFGVAAGFVALVSLCFPDSFLRHAWRLNPRGHDAFTGMGAWAFLLLGPVCAACLAAAVGLRRGARWGHRLAVTLLAVNLAGDLINVLLGVEPRAAFGLPVAAFILAYLLTERVRSFFSKTERA